MAGHRPKIMKTIANLPRRTFKTGGPSSATPGRPTKKRDPFFAPELQASRLACFHGRKLAYVRYADVPWSVEEGFQFPHELEVQGTNTFIELQVQRNTNHAQPTTNALKMNFTIKQGILVNWLAEILRFMSGIATSSSKLLAYGIFISRIIDHMEIDTSDVEIKLTNTHDHQLGEYLIHKMGIYKITGTWMYQEDYRNTVYLDLSDEETSTLHYFLSYLPPRKFLALQVEDGTLLDSRLSERVSPGREMAHLGSGKLGDTERFSPERDLARLGEGESFSLVKSWFRVGIQQNGKGMRKDPKVGCGVGGTCKVTKDQTQHSP
ncbi:hypothetical protein Lal_00000653, partial [Lupinus albus]